GRIAVPVARPVQDGLLGLARAAAVPLKSVLLAAHLQVVSFLAGRRDVLTGLILNGRPEDVDGDRVIGTFNNTVPLRLELPEGTWQDLVGEAFRAEAELLPFRRYPFAQLKRDYGDRMQIDTAFNFTDFHIYEKFIG